jgi:chromosome segregation ATPase
MPELTRSEAEILGARESLARAFARLEKFVALIPEKIKGLESAASEARARSAELQELLDRERVINAQRDSLSESTKEEIKGLLTKVEQLEAATGEGDERVHAKEQTIIELEAMLADFRTETALKNAEIERLNSEITSSKAMSEELLTKLDSLHEANTNLQGQCLRYETEINQILATESAYAKKLSENDKASLLSTIDTIIAKIDTLAPTIHSNGH